MATSELLDFERLRELVSEDAPCGESLRWDPLWDEIREARESRSDAVDESADSVADWPAVFDLTSTALYSRSKDLMIAGWLVESLVHLHGLAGLRDGLRAITELVETFWDDLHPAIDDDGDLEVRAAPLIWLTDRDAGARMPSLLRAVVPLARIDDDGDVLSWSYSNSRFIPPQGENEDEEAYERRKADAERKRQRFESAVAATPLEFYTHLHDDLEACKQHLSRLAVAVDDRLGDAAPGWTALRQSLEDIETLVKRILNDKGGFPAEAPQDNGSPVGEADAGATNGQTGGGARGPIRNRAEAIARLKECAAFLKQNEPHSLVASLVQRACNWAEMPLDRVLADLVKDESVRSQIEETLGVRALRSDDDD